MDIKINGGQLLQQAVCQKIIWEAEIVDFEGEARPGTATAIRSEVSNWDFTDIKINRRDGFVDLKVIGTDDYNIYGTAQFRYQGTIEDLLVAIVTASY